MGERWWAQWLRADFFVEAEGVIVCRSAITERLDDVADAPYAQREGELGRLDRGRSSGLDGPGFFGGPRRDHGGTTLLLVRCPFHAAELAVARETEVALRRTAVLEGPDVDRKHRHPNGRSLQGMVHRGVELFPAGPEPGELVFPRGHEPRVSHVLEERCHGRVEVAAELRALFRRRLAREAEPQLDLGLLRVRPPVGDHVVEGPHLVQREAVLGQVLQERRHVGVGPSGGGGPLVGRRRVERPAAHVAAEGLLDGEIVLPDREHRPDRPERAHEGRRGAKDARHEDVVDRPGNQLIDMRSRLGDVQRLAPCGRYHLNHQNRSGFEMKE